MATTILPMSAVVGFNPRYTHFVLEVRLFLVPDFFTVECVSFRGDPGGICGTKNESPL